MFVQSFVEVGIFAIFLPPPLLPPPEGEKEKKFVLKFSPRLFPSLSPFCPEWGVKTFMTFERRGGGPKEEGPPPPPPPTHFRREGLFLEREKDSFLPSLSRFWGCGEGGEGGGYCGKTIFGREGREERSMDGFGRKRSEGKGSNTFRRTLEFYRIKCSI